jgi:hypothetical protein
MIRSSPIPLSGFDLAVSSLRTAGAGFSSENAHRYEIQMRSTAEKMPQPELLSLLEGLLPLSFKVFGPTQPVGAGQIIIEDSPESAPRRDHPSVPSLRLPPRHWSGSPDELIDLEIHFVDDPQVPFPFRGRSLRSKVAPEVKTLQLSADEKALANTAKGPVWAVSRQGDRTHFRSGFALPELSVDGSLIEVLSGDRFLEMLPLIHWLREICAGTAYHEPPLRACFIFDDPNLHWPRYGFVDYRQIAVRAATLNYHVAFATIPLDSWFTHQPTARIFRESEHRLSLLVHGNNHLKRELALDYAPPAREALLLQAMRRSDRTERNAGFPVCRVMVPPHGACSEEMLKALPRCGFEAACISHGSLRSVNQTKRWTRSLGYLPSELIEGCPVLPRWGLSGTTNIILLAAFLGQPMILRGHHQDLKNGIEVLDRLAGFINGLGPVTWSNVTALSRMNYQWRLEGNTLWVKPLGRKALVQLPAGVESLIVESPSNDAWNGWHISGTSTPSGTTSGKRVSVSGAGDRTILIEAATPFAVPLENGSSRTPIAAFLRRCLTEGRDRFLDSRRAGAVKVQGFSCDAV